MALASFRTPVLQRSLCLGSTFARPHRPSYRPSEGPPRIHRRLASPPGDEPPAWTVKFPLASEGGDVTRRELVFKAPATAVPDAVLQLLHAYVRTAPLAPIAKLVTRRRRIEKAVLSLREGKTRR